MITDSKIMRNEEYAVKFIFFRICRISLHLVERDKSGYVLLLSGCRITVTITVHFHFYSSSLKVTVVWAAVARVAVAAVARVAVALH